MYVPIIAPIIPRSPRRPPRPPSRRGGLHPRLRYSVRVSFRKAPARAGWRVPRAGSRSSFPSPAPAQPSFPPQTALPRYPGLGCPSLLEPGPSPKVAPGVRFKVAQFPGPPAKVPRGPFRGCWPFAPSSLARPGLPVIQTMTDPLVPPRVPLPLPRVPRPVPVKVDLPSRTDPGQGTGLPSNPFKPTSTAHPAGPTNPSRVRVCVVRSSACPACVLPQHPPLRTLSPALAPGTLRPIPQALIACTRALATIPSIQPHPIPPLRRATRTTHTSMPTCFIHPTLNPPLAVHAVMCVCLPSGLPSQVRKTGC